MTWHSGNGYKISFTGGTNGGSVSGTAMDDSAGIDLGDAGIWTGDKITLNGVTPLFGSQDKIQMIKVKVPGDTTCALMSASGNLPGLLTITGPSGATATGSANLVDISGPNLEPNSTTGNEKTITFKLAVANAILSGVY